VSHIVSFQRQLMNQAKAQIDRGRYSEAAHLLDRVIHHPRLEPEMGAEANFLLSQIHFACADVGEAERSARLAVNASDENPDYHFILARALEEDGDENEALNHYAVAARLAPEDSHKVLSYARVVAKQKSSSRGVRLMQSVYARKSDDPSVVASVVEGLMANDQVEEAELVVRQVMYRHGEDVRFRRIRDRFRSLRCEMLLGRKAMGSDGSCEVVPYRNPRVLAMGKPGGARRPNRDDSTPPPKPPVKRPISFEPIAIDEGMTTLEILRRSGGGVIGGIYDSLGLLGKIESDSQAREIAAFLADADSLARVVRELPTASRKLLKTLVQLGGYVPATAVFQTTGPDAPPPDFAQPLFAAGLASFGRTTRNRRRPMVIAIPVDLLGRLARILKIKGSLE
jgi:Flp pilus assembly protein TadD